MAAMKLRTALALVVICASLPSFLRAQPQTQIQQFERTQRGSPLLKTTPLTIGTNTFAPEMYPGENQDVGPQRILRVKPRRTFFEAIADSQYFYTDNARLSDDAKVGSALFVNTIQAAFAPEPYRIQHGQFAPMIGYRSQWFNYDLDGHNDNLNTLDFHAQTAFLNGRYQIGMWQFYAGTDFTRLLNYPSYSEAYKEFVPTFAIQKFFPVNDRLIFIVGGQFSYHLTDTTALLIGTNLLTGKTVNDRYDVIGNVSFSYEVLPKLIVQPLYRFQYTHYWRFADSVSGPAAASRVDFVHTVGISVAYYFNKNVAARVFAGYERRDSDFSSAYDYHKFDGGGGVSLLVRF
jgi:hypothetical protein